MAAPVAVPGFERVKNENPFGYTEDQLGEKKLALKTMMELYPGVPYSHAEWVYDLCKNTPEEQLKQIMKKVDEEPSRYVATPGESYDLEVIDSSDSLMTNNEVSEKK
jgi:hypothetical protein|tara:strand:- start:5215 stop:5535 length:321 start_codon:yes stop_codon:yes gene_type:complete